ncbi:type II toxin-antitoxin system Phd/YefM family antitoxin [bacterium]|nr:type II toxin-antitoxin system Phd/YefM family antitoxin [bacterium]
MVDPTSVHPITDFKRNTPAFVKRLKETGKPEVLTIEGRGELVVQDAAAYQELLRVVERVEAFEGIRRGLADIEAGQHVSLDEFESEMRKKYEIPQQDEL